MADRVSVMSWLEGLAQDDWRQYHSDGEVQEIARSALDLLKEQEPVEPVEEWAWYDCYKCGACGKLWGETYEIERWNYCPWCGRAVKWDD